MPAGAFGFAIDYNYHSMDYPQWICTQFGDGFAILVERNGTNTSVSLDSMGNPVTSNAAFFAVTSNSNADQLVGTGFEANGATGWLSSAVPALPGEVITLRVYIWDSGDGIIDSTVLLDNFRWLDSTPTPPTPPAASR